MIKKLCGLALTAVMAVFAYTAQAVAQVDIEHDTSGVRLGYWTSDFAAAKAKADSEHIPMVGFWGSAGCGYCALMKSSGLLSDEFLAWVKTHKIIMCYVEVPASQTSVMTTAKEFIKGSNKSGLYPFMTFYWNKADGSQVKVDFSGRKGSIPPYAKGTTGAQFVSGLNNYFGSYKPQPPVESYTGGYLTLTNASAAARLEAIAGKTTFVNIPMERISKAVSTNRLQIAGATVTVNWAANVTNQLYKYTIPSTAKAGDTISLKLLTADGKTVKSTGAIYVVSEPAVSLTNPKWLGESFTTGEWTMDLDAALNKAKNMDQMYTLAYASGVLWCPYCASLETKVLSNAKFTQWAKDNNVNLVLLDNPKRSASDVKDADGNVTSVGTKADGDAPTLLRYAVGSNGKSGAAYMSRKMITVGTPTTKGTAEYVLQRNHDLLYKGGKLAAPEVMRTGYPTLILVNPDGTVAANLLSGSDSSGKVWGITLEETLARLSQLLMLEGGNMKHAKPSTTDEQYEVEEWADGGGQVNDNVRFLKIVNAPAGKVTFEAEAYSMRQKKLQPVLTVYDAPTTLAKATKLGSGTGSVTVTFANGKDKYLAISCYTDNLAAYGEDTEYYYSLFSKVTLVPSQSPSTFTTKSGKMDMTVTAGTKYKLSGFADYAAFTKNADGTYTANKSGTIAMSAKEGGKVSFQIWTPGTVQFTTTTASKMEADGSGTITVSRTGGASGTASMTVSVNKGSNGSGRVSVSPTTLTWADGTTGSKTVTYKITAQAAVNPDETFTITLAKASTSAATLGANKTFTLKVSDSSDPELAKESFAVRCFSGMENSTSYAVSNIRENKNVTFAKTGTLPRGMNLSYNAASKAIVLSGKPTRTGTYDFTVTISEKGSDGKTSTGKATAFKVSVVDPKTIKQGEQGYNPVITAGKTVYGSIPVYGKLNGKTVLAGIATLKAYRSGRATVIYKGTDGARLTVAGTFALNAAGTAQVRYVRGNVDASFAVNSSGMAAMTIRGLPNRFGTMLSSSNYKLFNGNFAAYAGYYTVTLPANTADLTAGKETIPTGTGYITLKMNTATFSRQGKVSYSGLLANGRTFSGYAYLSGVMTTKDGAQWSYLPVSVSKTDAGLGAVLRIKRDAAKTHGEDPQVVLAAAGSTPFMMIGDDYTSLNVYGGIYDRTLDFTKCCEDYYETTTFKFDSVTKWFAPSAQYGAIKTVPNSKVSVEPNDTFSVINGDPTHAVSLRLTKSSGVVSGRTYVTFANGRRVALTIRGVVLVGWVDCGCTDDSAVTIERPIFSGAAFYNDRINGASAKRGFAVELKP